MSDIGVIMVNKNNKQVEVRKLHGYGLKLSDRGSS